MYLMNVDGAPLAAIEAVYRDRSGDFFRLALARLGDPELARDSVQEGFARAIKSRRTFRSSGSLEAWICRCVLNAAYDSSHRGAAMDPLQTVDEAAVDFHEVNELVREALGQLPQRQRDALFVRFYLDFDYAAIAETLGIAVGTVSATLHAARAALARALEEVKT
jgi:RNA polymerase sigma factor (sigma-70 family)